MSPLPQSRQCEMVETGRCTDLQLGQRTHLPSKASESSLPRSRLKPFAVASVKSSSSLGDHCLSNIFRAARSGRIVCIALNLPFLLRTLIPWERGRWPQTGGIAPSQKPYGLPAAQPCADEFSFRFCCLGDSGNRREFVQARREVSAFG